MKMLLHKLPRLAGLRVGVCASLSLVHPGLQAAETVWFGGTQRALPVNLAAPKEDGLYSNWAFTDENEKTWDFNLGTDVSIWQRTSDTSFQSINGRFGVAARFQYDSESFDLWAADFRGGALWGLRRERMAYELFLYHESSHLGDEILERGQRPRMDYSVNGIRVMTSQQWTELVRTYEGISGQPWADPDDLVSFGFHAGAELTSLPPWRRGFVALDSAWWEWREWDPDLTARLGLFLSPRKEETARMSAFTYLELHYGSVMLGQFYNETEKYLAAGLGLYW